jgi:hypothetical protein
MSDFWLPNGSFCDTSYEAISYATGSRTYPESARYSVPATPLPPSETEGLDALDIQGTIWGNLPEVSADYVSRPRLEAEFEKILLDERHPTITLAGRGGIGKTSLALSSLHQLIERQGPEAWRTQEGKASNLQRKRYLRTVPEARPGSGGAERKKGRRISFREGTSGESTRADIVHF